MSTSPLLATRDAVVIPLPRPAADAHPLALSADTPGAGARQREARTRHQLARHFDTAATAPERPEDWRRRSLCAQTDPEAFFPEKGGSTREAKRICAGCPVKTQCLEEALRNDERFGIWGGLSERERRRLRRTLRG